LDFIQSNFILV